MTDRQTDGQTFAIVESLLQLKMHFACETDLNSAVDPGIQRWYAAKYGYYVICGH